MTPQGANVVGRWQVQNKYVGNPPSRRYGHSATAIGTLEFVDIWREEGDLVVCVGLSQNETQAIHGTNGIFSYMYHFKINHSCRYVDVPVPWMVWERLRAPRIFNGTFWLVRGVLMNVGRRFCVALMNKNLLFQKMMNPKPRKYPLFPGEFSSCLILRGGSFHPVKGGAVFFTPCWMS